MGYQRRFVNVTGPMMGIADRLLVASLLVVLGLVTVQPARAQATKWNAVQWRHALAKVRNGSGNAKILCIGDSTTYGFGTSLTSTYPTRYSYPSQLAAQFNSEGIPASMSFGIPASAITANQDRRWVLGTGWTKVGYGAAGAAAYQGKSTTDNLVYTPNIKADTYDIYYLVNSPLGILQATATGGATTAIDESSGTNGIGMTTIQAGSASPANTVTFSSSGNCYVLGVRARLSGTCSVLIDDCGVNSSTTANWATDGPYASIPFIKAMAPDLTIISLGVNDAGHSVPATTFSHNLRAIIRAAEASGDVILMTMPPSKSTPWTTFEPLYLPVYAQLAAGEDCGLLNTYTQFGGVWTQTLMHDQLHPDDEGYRNIAKQVFQEIAHH